jgi:hypothetical protein
MSLPAIQSISKNPKGISFTLIFDVYSTRVTYDDHHIRSQNIYILSH